MMELCPSGPLYLELGNGIQAVLKRLSTSRRETSSIDSLVLRGRYCRFIDTHVSFDEIQDVLRMASCLPNLKRLSLLRLRVPIRAITQALQAQHGLTELELRSVCLWGSWHEMEELAQALAQASLVKLSLADCRPEGGSCEKLDALLVGLSRMPSLNQVELDMMELTRWLDSIDSFSLLLKAPNLKRLSLSYMRLPDAFILALAQALTAPSDCAIEELYLDRCDSLTPTSVWVMANMLQHNTRLTQLHLVLKNYEDAIPIANALHQARHSTQLHTLLLRTYHHPRMINTAVLDAFRAMLQDNYTLTKLEMFQGHPMKPLLGEYWPILQFYLDVNKAGRAKLMLGDHDVSNEEWIHTICQARQDLNCSFYFLSQNPSVLFSSSSS